MRRALVTALALTTAAVIATPLSPASAAAAPAVVNVSIDPTQPGVTWNPDFTGISFEKRIVATTQTDATRGNLGQLLASLGSPVLRFGGNTADRYVWSTDGTVPSKYAALNPALEGTIGPSDLTRLAGLVQASHATVIYGLNLRINDPDLAAQEAKAAKAALGDSLLAVEVGNEPNNYVNLGYRSDPYDVTSYQTEFNAYKSAIQAQVPGLAVAGPSAYSGPWISGFNPGGQGILLQHIYPLNACSTPPPTIATMLTRNAAKNVISQTQSGLTAAAAQGVPLRIDETNNLICSGEFSVSDTFASALWVTDHLSAIASLGAAGVNLHNGNMGTCGIGGSAAYTMLCANGTDALAANTFTPQPEWAGVQFVQPLVGTRFVPTTTTSVSSTSTNYVARATVDTGGTIRVLLDEMDLNGGSGATVNLTVPPGYRFAGIQRLTAPNLSAQSPITVSNGEVLGGANGVFPVVMPAASAALVTLTTGPATPTVSLTATPAGGAPLTARVSLTTTVTGFPNAVPTGAVTVTAGGTPVASCGPLTLVPVSPTASAATCVTRGLPAGTRDLAVTYPGDAAHYNPASATLPGFAVGSKGMRFTKSSIEVGDGALQASYGVTGQSGQRLTVRLTASAPGRATRTATASTATGTVRVTGLVDNVKYTVRLEVTSADDRQIATTFYSFPRHLPTLTMKGNNGKLRRGLPEFFTGTVKNAGKPVANQVVQLYATVGTRSVVQATLRTNAQGQFSSTQRPRVTTTYQAKITVKVSGVQGVSRSAALKVTVV